MPIACKIKNVIFILFSNFQGVGLNNGMFTSCAPLIGDYYRWIVVWEGPKINKKQSNQTYTWVATNFLNMPRLRDGFCTTGYVFALATPTQAGNVVQLLMPHLF